MPISQEDKQKYIEYLKSRGKEVPKGMEEVVIDFESFDDPVLSLVESTIEQLSKKNPEVFESFSDEQILELKENVYSYILSEAFAATLDVEEGYYNDPELLNQSREIADVEEMLALIFVKAAEDNKVAENFTKGLFNGYYNYASKQDIAVDNRFKEVMNK